MELASRMRKSNPKKYKTWGEYVKAAGKQVRTGVSGLKKKTKSPVKKAAKSTRAKVVVIAGTAKKRSVGGAVAKAEKISAAMKRLDEKFKTAKGRELKMVIYKEWKRLHTQLKALA